MKTLLTSLVLGAFLSVAPTMSMASDCSCSKKCQTNCAKGQTKDCKCKSCDCAKTGKCKHETAETKSS